MPPCGRGVGSHDRNAVPVCEEFAQPRYVAVATAERRIHKNGPEPRLRESVLYLGVDHPRRYPMPNTRTARIEVEHQIQSLEDLWWRVPIIGFTDRIFVLSHCVSPLARTSKPA